VRQRFSQVGVTLRQQDLARIEAHEDTTTEQQATHTQRANALHLAVSIREALAGRLQ
jgi:hypothetical protein